MVETGMGGASCSDFSSFAENDCIAFVAGGTGRRLGGLMDLLCLYDCFSEGEIKGWFGR